MSSLSQFLNIDKLLNNVSQLGIGKNPTTHLYIETTKIFLSKKDQKQKKEKKKGKNATITKQYHA